MLNKVVKLNPEVDLFNLKGKDCLVQLRYKSLDWHFLMTIATSPVNFSKTNMTE
jgi:hypothetical protein